jgi:hypothetical protein
VTALACSPTEPLFVAAAAPRGPSFGDAPQPSLRRGVFGAFNLRASRRVGSYVLPGEPAVCSLAFSRDGGLLAAGTEEGQAALFDPAARPQPARVWAASALPRRGPAAGGGAAVLFRPGGAGGAGAGPDGGLLTLRGGCVQEWSLSNLRAPAATVDVAAAAAAVVASAAAAAGGARGSPGFMAAAMMADDGTGESEADGDADLGGPHFADPGSGSDDGRDDAASGGGVSLGAGGISRRSGGGGGATGALEGDEGGWSFSFAVDPAGCRVAVACGRGGGGSGGGGAPGGGAVGGDGCVLLYDISGGIWRPPEVLLVSPLLAGACPVGWHPSAAALVCGGGEGGGALLTLRLGAH